MALVLVLTLSDTCPITLLTQEGEPIVLRYYKGRHPAKKGNQVKLCIEAPQTVRVMTENYIRKARGK